MVEHPFDIVEIVWYDHFSHTSWVDVWDYKPERYPCISVGYLIRKDKHQHSLALSLTKELAAGDVMNILSKAIVSVELIKPAKAQQEEELGVIFNAEPIDVPTDHSQDPLCPISSGGES